MKNVQNNTSFLHFWKYPWGFKQSFVIIFAFALNLFILQVIVGYFPLYLDILRWPINLIVLILIMIGLFLVSLSFSHLYFIQWLISTDFVLAILCVICIFVFLAGTIPQQGIFVWNNIVSSLAFIFLIKLLIISLTLCLFHHILYDNVIKLGWILYHGGFLIVLLCMFFGRFDYKHLQVYAHKNRYINVGFDLNDFLRTHPVKLPFDIYLKNFSIAEYSPKILMVEHTKLDDLKKVKLFDINEHTKEIKIKEYVIQVQEYLKEAFKVDDKFYANNSEGAVHAAYIKVYKNSDPKTVIKEGWISSSSFNQKATNLIVDDKVIMLTYPQAKQFSSDIIIKDLNTNTEYEMKVEVNNPAKFAGWHIYQASYDSEKGKWSRLSILELIYDPWLKGVYIGFIIMFIGILELLGFKKIHIKRYK